jgi:hypothetical protein
VEGERRLVVLPALPQDSACFPITELVAISEQAAALTGALALMDPDDRSQGAVEAAVQTKGLARRATELEGGEELARALGDLARALDDYSGGDPVALASLRAASAQNAATRRELEQHSCGGVEDE